MGDCSGGELALCLTETVRLCESFLAGTQMLERREAVVAAEEAAELLALAVEVLRAGCGGKGL